MLLSQDLNTIMYLAIDPGNTTGWAIFDDNGETIEFNEITGHDAFLDWLDERTESFDEVIIEEYRVRNQQFNHQGSTIPTVQLIGAITRWARKRGIPISMQPSSVLPIACKFVGYPYRQGSHVPDRISALAHGVFWLQKKKIRKNRLAK